MQEHWSTIALFALGVALIIKGGDWFVEAASWIAETAGIPRFIVGATIVSVATTMPEILVSLMSASQGKVDMAAGNAIGSVTVNMGVIMGVSVLAMPSVIDKGEFRNKALLMAAACALLLVSSQNGSLGLVPALLAAVLFALFLADNVRSAKLAADDHNAGAKPPCGAKTVWLNIAKFAFGAAGIVIGADLLVNSGSELARLMGVPERVIALTLVAIGTSLPELVTTITAIAKKQSSLSIGNIIGANVIDLALILPLSGFISGGSLPVSPLTARLDLPVCMAEIVLAVVPTLIAGRFKRWQGVAMLGLYIAYIAFTLALPAIA